MVALLLKDAGETLKGHKCAFSTNGIDYLGSITRPGRLKVAHHTADAIRELKTPTAVREL